ncbi:RagB/SusD family nutrient uptake outer membrane protein [Sphingobacterium sp. SGR-19]|uniref:RagB/SusD family nutrient uptake outer membrane protein n=1 Tax=Sphingobacterium sp. SGR-19 TaxID=2710886 RepID=UPI0013E9CF9F|nr:RagB/SusD family nutrient uptake outer membrane protein [Sphingobacterium sp. SGR-19]NGM65939.1 RagB/SusD family nutrient uptake outer membrane protein [Sphingobacterium sp. SGR-19]
MKIVTKILLVVGVLAFSACDKFLDRPPLTSENDDTAWDSEEKLRLYANKYYTSFFTGYNTGTSTGGAPLVGYTNSDDMVIQGNQPNFTRAVPNSGIWSYTTIRSLNLMLDRIETRMGGVLEEEDKAHWIGIGRFFRGFEYADLVRSYGDVPYYDHVVSDTDPDDLYKPRTPRNEVMNAVYDDWRYALDNVRLTDGDRALTVDRYVVAGFVSRLALYEGTWQKYYYNNNEQAKKFLELAVEAAQMVMSSGRYNIVTDYKSLFASDELRGNQDMVLYRNYDAAVGITHSIASYGNLAESTNNGPSTDLIKAYLCADGRPWQESGLNGADEFHLDNLIKTRDSRFEATFYSKPEPLNRGSLYYITKFLPREVEKLVKEDGGAMPAEFTGSRNETDAPVLRYAEVLLNWIEAKVELAEIGGAPVTQDEIDRSINKIRDRPLAPEAEAKGVQKTAHLQLAAISSDPDRDQDVSPLLWEIRRERRMEFAFETSRLLDLRRWGKVEYMDNDLNSDLLSGGWVNFPQQLPTQLSGGNIDLLAVVDLDGNEIIYNGANGDEMIGFYRRTSNGPRLPFLNQPNINPYLTPIGRQQIDEYAIRGYVLEQTEGWPEN